MRDIQWAEGCRDKLVSYADAVKYVRSGDYILSTLFSSIPYALLNELAKRKDELSNVTLMTGAASESYDLLRPECNGHIDLLSFFLGPAEREGRDKYGSKTNFQIMQLSSLCADRRMAHKPDVVMMSAAPPDEQGNISLGLVPISSDICRSARNIILQFDEKIPFVYSPDCMLRIDDITCGCVCSNVEQPYPRKPLSKSQIQIAEYIADMIPDGACIQLGIGNIGDQIGELCRSKHHLGIHTEIFVESMVDLIECGAVDNSMKNIDRGYSIFGMAFGSEKINQFMNHNSECIVRSVEYSNSPYVISKNDNVHSANSAMQIDLTGQVASEGIGYNTFSGIGGQLDFVRGSQLSRGGHSFLALESIVCKRNNETVSKIVLGHQPGTAITTPRSEVEYIVTEFGVVNLKNESIENRAKKLISIAHPDFRDELLFYAKKVGYII